MIYFVIFSIAVITSIVAGLIGIGGGIVLVPVLTTISGISHLHAAGTVLAAVFIFSTISSLKNSKNKLIVWQITLIVASGSITGTILGSQFSLNLSLISWKILFIFIALFLVYNMLFTNNKRYSIFESLHKFLNILPLKFYSSNINSNLSCLGLFIFGVIVGSISVTLGLGGGFLATPFFILGLKLKPKQAVASSLAVIAITSLSGAISHYLLGHFSINLWFAATAGMAIGGYFGALYLKKIPENYIKFIYAATISFAIILIILK